MNFSLSVQVVLPLCIYISVGMLAKKRGYLEKNTTSQMNRLIFRFLFPLVMFDNVMNAGETLRSGDLSILLYLVLLIFAEFLLLMWVTPYLIQDRRRQGSFIQGCIRSNSVLFAIPIVSAICGSEHTGVAAMCVAIAVPFYNVLCVIALEMKRGGKVTVLHMLKGIATNPLILGAAAGAALLLSGLTLPNVLSKSIKTLASMVTPLALLLLGADLKFDGMRKDILHLSFVGVIKLVVIPAITVGSAWLLGYRGVNLISVFALSCVPTAVSSYPMAEQMGADEPFAGEIVAFTTVISMATVFLWISLLSGIGVI